MRLAVLLGLLAALLAGCGREPLYQSQGYVFGTLVDVSIYGESESRARELADHILQDFQGLHQQLHAWQPDSELSRLNQAFAKGSEPVPVSADLAKIITDATRFAVKSEGLFNPAIGGLIEQWGFHRDEFLPIRIDPEAIAALVAASPKMTDIVIENGQAYSRNQAVQLDLGGYAKGYALDRAVAYLREQGADNALINIGGNIIALGKHGEKPWRVGIQHPRQPGPIATLDLQDGWAIGTSGDYQRYFMMDGKRYCHVIDPYKGYPVQDVQAVTVLVPPGPQAGTLSDVASKPIFIAAPQHRAAMAEALDIANVMLIDGQGTVFVSAEMAKRLQWVTKNVAAQDFR
jgi:thiamine biosynthesis lipoprotein